jgi:L-rhamnose mutarotase
VRNTIVSQLSTQELELELEKRKAFLLRDRYIAASNIADYIRQHREIFLGLAELMQNQCSIRFLENDNELWGPLDVVFDIYNNDTLFAECFDNHSGKKVWDKFEKT